MAAIDQEVISLESSAVEECLTPEPIEQGEVSLPDKSEVLETIDLSNSNSPQQEELVFVNVDFEEIAQAVFGQLHFIDQVLAENLDSISEIADHSQSCLLEETSNDQLIKTPPPTPPQENFCEELDGRIDLTTITQEKEKQDKVIKTTKKESGKNKSKEDKSIEHILKALNSLDTTEEKLAALCKKYSDLLGEHRSLQNTVKQSERKAVQLQKEKEQIQSEHSKAVLTRSRLESLCRELQRQNKIVKDESLMKIREEEERRKEVSAKFQTTLNEISSMMQDNNQKCSKLREENIELAQKLKSLIEQYEAREQQVEKVITQKEHETQLAETKVVKANMMMVEEREKFLREKQKCLQDIADYQRRCQEMATNEVQLRTQLSLYTDKYEEFQTTLSKSNEVFSHFKEEMDKMSKKIKKLEKETGSWKTRWESSNKALLEMAADKQRRDLELLNSTKKIVQLEKLCRALQTERQVYLSQLKGVAQNAGDEALTTEENGPSEVLATTEENPVTVSTDTGTIPEAANPEQPNEESLISKDLNAKELTANPCDPNTAVTEIVTSDKSQEQTDLIAQVSKCPPLETVAAKEEISQQMDKITNDNKNDELTEKLETIIPTKMPEENKEALDLSQAVINHNEAVNDSNNDLLTKDTLKVDANENKPDNATESNKNQLSSPKTNKTKDNKGRKKGKFNVKSESASKKNVHSK